MRLRRAAGLSPFTVARAAGVDVVAVVRYERSSDALLPETRARLDTVYAALRDGLGGAAGGSR